MVLILNLVVFAVVAWVLAENDIFVNDVPFWLIMGCMLAAYFLGVSTQ